MKKVLREKWRVWAVGSAAAALLLLFTAAGAYAQNEQQGYQKMKCVVIDAGHGGRDYGCISPDKKYNEKSIVLSVALKLGKMLKEEHPDIKIVYTRDKDVFIPLDERAAIANRNKADLFLSIHTNSLASNLSRISGSETYTMGNQVSQGNFDIVKRENAVIAMEDDYTTKYEGFDPSSPESYIIFSLLQNAHSEQSIKFATYIQKEYAKGPVKLNRGVKQAGFVVLWRTTMPSVLTEIGFLSNEEDRKIITTEKGQREIARRLCDAFGKYRVDYEKALLTEEEEEKALGKEKENNKENEIEAEKKVEKKATADEGKRADNQKSKVVYAVQIMATPKRLQSSASHFKGRKDVRFVQENGLYKYYVGGWDTKQQAQQNLPQIAKLFKGAFVIGVKEGKIVDRVY